MPEVVVVIASAGRAALLGLLLADLRQQTRPPSAVVVAVPGPEHLPADLPGHVRVVHGSGAAAQRNAGIDAALDPADGSRPADLIFFFDDDAVLRADYLERAVAFLADHPEVVGVTGRVLRDGSGASAPEVPRHEALAALAASATGPPLGTWHPVDELYGCNFGYRTGPDPSLRFDARLPLYSWLEDLDFAGRLLRHGQLAKADDVVAVHLGVASGGRVAHHRLGYSQVMNPAYLRRKGTIGWRRLGYEVGPRLAGNALRSVRHPERRWRRRRLAGNLRALGDLARWRFSPERILDLTPG